MGFQETEWGFRLSWTGSGQGEVACFCKYGNEPSGFIKKREISGLAKRILAFQEGTCPLELENKSLGVRIFALLRHFAECVGSYRRFGTDYKSLLQGSNSPRITSGNKWPALFLPC
jgi:hypothetical protein